MPESAESILKKAVDMNASDIFMIPGMPISMKINGDIHPIDDEKVFPDAMDKLIEEIYTLADIATLPRCVPAEMMTSPSRSAVLPDSAPAS